jgi:hypothetical protein
MAVDTERLEQALAEKGITGWYTWRPNQIYTKDPSDPDQYKSTDVMNDGALDDIFEAAREAGRLQINAIRQAGTQKVDEINTQDTTYVQIKAICLKTFRSMRNYFSQQGMGTTVADLDSAIKAINNPP